MEINKIPYPKEEIEHLTTQIVKLAEANKIYRVDLQQGINVLISSLELLVKPIMILKTDKPLDKSGRWVK